MSSTTDQFPSNSSDPQSTPNLLVDLIDKELKAQKSPEILTNRPSSSTHLNVPQATYNRGFSGRRSASDISHHKISLHQLNLLSIETWYCHTRCVSLAFVSNLTREATLNAIEFVHDFPVQLWLLQPRKIAELLSPTQSPSGSPPSGDSIKSLAAAHLLLDLPQEVELKLERLHFLFLMRLKDSFQGFKNRLMQYLTLDSLLEAQQTEAFHIHKDDESDENDGEELRDKLSAAFKNDPAQANSSKEETGNSLVTASACVQGIRVIISLPSLGPILKGPKQGTPVQKQHSKVSINKSSSAQALLKPNLESSQSSVSNRDQRAQSMPHLSVQLSPEAKSRLHSSTTPSLQGSSDEFVYIAHPSNGDASQSVSPTPMDLIPEGIELLPDAISNPSGQGDFLSSSENSANLHSSTGDVANGLEVTLNAEKRNSADNPNAHVHNVSTAGSPTIQVPPVIIDTSVSPQPSLVPTHSLYIKTGGLKLLLCLSDQGITLRTTVDTLHIDELTEAELNELDRKKTSKKDGESNDNIACPVIKARVELGKNVLAKYFPNLVPETSPLDGVVFLKVSGLKAVLGIKNIMAVKDFFDDEKESDTPIPIQIRIVETQLVIKDQLALPLVHPKNIVVNVPDIFVNRGPRAHGTNLIQTESLDKQEVQQDPPPVVETVTTRAVNTDTNTDLLESFHTLINSFQTRTAQMGQARVLQPKKVDQLLKELERTLISPPSYNDSLSCDFYTNVESSSPHSTVESLMTEVEALRIDNKKLQLELVNAREEHSNTANERDEMTTQLIDVKLKLASAHLVLEQQLITMERLHSENSNLKDRLGE